MDGFKPDIDKNAPLAGGGGANGFGFGFRGGGVPGATLAGPAPTTNPQLQPPSDNARGGQTGSTGQAPIGDADTKKAVKEAIAKLRTALLDAETEMAVAKRTILCKNAEINKLEDQIRFGRNDPTLSVRLAAAERERDEARKKVADLTIKLANSAGVLSGDLLVSYTQSFVDWTNQLACNTESLRDVNI